MEELARVYGYNRLPVTHIRADLIMQARPEAALSIRYLRRHLSARGYREAITYSFVDPELQRVFDPEQEPVALSNPMSADMAVMRTSLLPGLVSAVLHNTNRQQPRVRLFETGLRFLPGDSGLRQVPTLAMVCTGQRFAESWTVPGDAADFFDLKGDLESLLAMTRSLGDYAFEASFAPGAPSGAECQANPKGAGGGFYWRAAPCSGSRVGAQCAPLSV